MKKNSNFWESACPRLPCAKSSAGFVITQSYHIAPQFRPADDADASQDFKPNSQYSSFQVLSLISIQSDWCVHLGLDRVKGDAKSIHVSQAVEAVTASSALDFYPQGAAYQTPKACTCLLFGGRYFDFPLPTHLQILNKHPFQDCAFVRASQSKELPMQIASNCTAPRCANCVCLQYVYVAFLCLLVSQHFPHSLNLTTSWTLSMSYIWFSCPHFTPKVPLWIVRKVLGTILTQCYVIYVYLCAMVAVLAMVIEWKPHTLRYPRWLVGGNQPRFRVTCCESIWVDFRDYLRLWRLQKLRFSFTKGPQLSIAYFNYPSYHIISIISIRNRDEDDWWSKMCATMCNTYQHMDSCSCHDAFDVWSLFDSSNVGPSTEPAISELGWKK